MAQIIEIRIGEIGTIDTAIERIDFGFHLFLELFAFHFLFL